MRHSSEANVLSSFDILSEVIKLVSAIVVVGGFDVAVAVFSLIQLYTLCVYAWIGQHQLFLCTELSNAVYSH